MITQDGELDGEPTLLHPGVDPCCIRVHFGASLGRQPACLDLGDAAKPQDAQPAIRRQAARADNLRPAGPRPGGAGNPSATAGLARGRSPARRTRLRCCARRCAARPTDRGSPRRRPVTREAEPARRFAATCAGSDASARAQDVRESVTPKPSVRAVCVRRSYHYAAPRLTRSISSIISITLARPASDSVPIMRANSATRASPANSCYVS